MSEYKLAMTRAMKQMSLNERVVFLGQAVSFPGTAMSGTLEGVPDNIKIELPVEEDSQMGLSIGLAYAGFIPVSIYPRWNFLLLATNQIVNHLDKVSKLSRLTSLPKVIIRTGIGSESPFHPGPQHTGDFTDAFRLMCENINVVRLDHADTIEREYSKALNRSDGVSTILVEWGDFYNS